MTLEIFSDFFSISENSIEGRMESGLNLIIVVITILLGYLFFKRSKNDGYSLASLGIPHEKPIPFIGNMLNVMIGKENGVEFVMDYYKKFKNEK